MSYNKHETAFPDLMILLCVDGLLLSTIHQSIMHPNNCTISHISRLQWLQTSNCTSSVW